MTKLESFLLLALSGCPAVARTHAGVAEGPQGLYSGAYTCVTVEGQDAYVTLTTRGQVIADNFYSHWVGGQLAIGIGTFLVFAGANYAGGVNGALLLGGIGFVPEWRLRAGTPSSAPTSD